ncbi:MAG UNVERIFIED_CONTAM: hypothetical protein LVQ98_02010 [Rickettsiaceae bacterium]|jgi:hypothetical protein
MNNGYKIGAFLGQLQKFSKNDNMKSDIVGRAYLNMHDTLELYYRFRKNSHTMSSLFDECGVWYNMHPLTLSGGLINLKENYVGNHKTNSPNIY